MDEELLRDSILRQLGWEQLVWPAKPEWQRPGTDGVEYLYNVPALSEVIDMLVRARLERDALKDAVIVAISKIASWHYKSAGQTLPTTIADAIAELELVIPSENVEKHKWLYDKISKELDAHVEQNARLREDLDRLTRGGWSKELARITAANMTLRAKIEMFQAWREKAVNLYPDLERLE